MGKGLHNTNQTGLKPAVAAHALARRIERIGGKPYASDNERYAVLLGNRSGEIVELGKPLRGSRLFPTKALGRNIALLTDIEAFAEESDTLNWRYWSIKSAGHKAKIDNLKQDLARFNADINSVFTELRKKNDFKLVILAIHVRYDKVADALDLHAHFICDVPPEQREAVRRRLSERFSLTDMPEEPIENISAAVTYAIWYVYDRNLVLRWPDDAIQAVWTLHSGQSKPQLVRTGKAFQRWRSARFLETHPAKRASRRTRRPETNGHRPKPSCGDRILAKTEIRIGGQKVEAFIVERALNDDGRQPRANKPTATVDTTQPTDDARLPNLPGLGVPSTDIPSERPRNRRGRHAPQGIPWRCRWWLKAWPMPVGVTREPRPIARRRRRLLS